MIPEPQTPVTPSDAVASAKPGSSDQRSQPITLKRGSSVSRSMRTRSIAPGAARWPQEICAPSKAGPVGEEQASRPLAIAEQDLGVGADVGDQRQFVAQIRPLGERDAGRVRADMAGDAGQRDRRRRRARCRARVRARAPRSRRRCVERERRAAELGRIEAEEEMMHDRIADDA